MNITKTPLEGLIVVQPNVFTDDRGYFYEAYQQKRFADKIPAFVQDNVSRSKQGILRGLHYQLPNAQGKLVGVTRGTVWDVAVDIRRSSPTFGQWFGITLSDENHTQMFIPPGFAHGFCVLSDEADFYYKCTDYYSPECDRGIAWDDPTINISWPHKNPLISLKDAQLPLLAEISDEQLFA